MLHSQRCNKRNSITALRRMFPKVTLTVSEGMSDEDDKWKSSEERSDISEEKLRQLICDLDRPDLVDELLRRAKNPLMETVDEMEERLSEVVTEIFGRPDVPACMS